MKKKYPSYSIAIRTLGRAGEKYKREIESIFAQTLKPEGVYVYIPLGYSVEPVRDEIYVVCEKGMVMQRSLPFSEINSDYILFLDDDMFLPIDAVKQLFDALIEYNADCIAVKAYEFSTLKEKVVAGVFGGTYPTLNSMYAYKVRDDSHFSYCLNPQKIMLTQTAPFACFLCLKDAYREIHFEDERWLDKFNYALGDDQLFFYKMFLKGRKILMHFDSGVEHLDAKTGAVPNKKKRDFNSRLIRFIIWHRTIYKCKATRLGQMGAIIAYSNDFLRSLFECIVRFIMGDFYSFSNSFKAIYSGMRYVKSKEYKSLPLFSLPR